MQPIREPAGGPVLVGRSGQTYPLTDPRWRAEDGTPLTVSPLPGIAPDDIDAAERSIWRYQAAIPVSREHRVSLGEGRTPLLPLQWAEQQVQLKLEWFSPTASFKDRGAAVLVSHLRSLGAQRILEDSSGNGGAAIAAYAAAAGMRVRLLVPAGASSAKIVQAKAYGADIQPVEGTRDDVGAEAVRQSARIPYASHNWHPFFLQGIKTLGYELWEDLGFRAPDNVVLVAGAGSMILGCDLAFTELLAAGQIERLPRLLIGQPVHWATIVDTLNGIAPGARGPRTPTCADGASIANPVRLPEAVTAVRRSGGAGAAVREDEIRSSQRRLAARGLYVEPTAAVAMAAYERFVADGTIRPEQTTVVVLTGSGLKKPE